MVEPERRGWTVQVRSGATNVPVGRAELRAGVGTVLLHQVPVADPPVGVAAPYPLLRAQLTYGIDGGKMQVTCDWQFGARIVIPGDWVEIVASFEATGLAVPDLGVTVTAAVVDGAPAPPTDWGFTVLGANLVPTDKEDLQIPEGAHSVNLFSPTQAGWGSLVVRQQRAKSAGTIIEYIPTEPSPVPLMPGARWIQVENIGAAALWPQVRFGLA